MSLRIASVNVNGIRAAARKGLYDWLEQAAPDIVALQEVRADAEQARAVLPDWHLEIDESPERGRAGVAIASRVAPDAVRHRLSLGDPDITAGRWIETDFTVGDTTVTLASAYVHTGEVDTPKQDLKWGFLDGLTDYLPTLAARSPLALVMGDLNVGHRELDIRNWRGNRRKSGFLPRERAYFDRFFGERGVEIECVDGSTGTGLGWVDVGRRVHGEVDGPYTWWSMRGRAFDNDTGWRIDYHVATPALAETVTSYRVDRADSWDTRWSDHAPVVVEYALG